MDIPCRLFFRDVKVLFLQLYPVGIKVITSEGETGIVVRQNKKFTDRPVIKMLKHSDGSLYEDEVEKDLMEYLTLFIVDTE